MFGLVCVTMKKGVISEVIPIGTLFFISHQLAITARHNLGTDDVVVNGTTFGAVKTLSAGVSVKVSDVVEMVCVYDCVGEDWAILKAVHEDAPTSPSRTFVEICEENELPARRECIGIKDFPVGMLSTASSTKLTVASTNVKIQQYEPRKQNNSRRKLTNKFTVVADDSYDATTADVVEDVIVVSCGRVMGSCGAPYFAANGKVVAFHFESVDETPENSSVGSTSHISYSHGYVLCRLPQLYDWYRSLADNPSSSSPSSSSSSSVHY